MSLLPDLDLLSDISGVSLEQLDALLTPLNPPQDLGQLITVMQTLEQVLKSLQGFIVPSDYHGSDPSPFSFMHVIEQINEGLRLRTPSDCPAAWLDTTFRRRGQISQHPIWNALIPAQGDRYYRNLELFQHFGIVIASCFSLQQKQTTSSIHSAIENACRDIRKLAAGKLQFDVLGKVAQSESLADYYTGRFEGKESLEKSFIGIELLIRKDLYEVKIRHSGSSRRSASAQPSRRAISSRDEDSEDDSLPQKTIRLRDVPSKRRSERIGTSGLHAEEESREKTAQFIEKDDPQLEPLSLYRRQTGEINHIILNNQRLPDRRPQLSHFEQAIAMNLAWQLFQAPKFSTDGHNLDPLVGFLLLLLIWLGREVPSLLRLRIYQHRADLPANRENIFAYLLDEGVFVLPVASTQWKRDLNDHAQHLLNRLGSGQPEDVQGSVYVYSPLRWTELLNEIPLQWAQKGRYARVFPDALHEDIENTAKEVLAKHRKGGRLRITLHSLGQVLFDEISFVSRDWVVADMLTGRHFTITPVAAHYFSISGNILASHFYQASLRLRTNLPLSMELEQELFQPHGLPPELDNIGHHGSRLSVPSRLPKLLVDHLLNKIQSARRFVKVERQLRELHNALVTYILCWVLFVTGYRAVDDIVFRVSEIDFNSGFLIIGDKADSRAAQYRVVWLPQALREQIDLYLNHLLVLEGKLQREQHLAKRIRELRTNPNTTTPLLFYINDNWTLKRATPIRIAREIGAGFTLPLNVGRHYLRSRLSQHGISGELINAFMGHGQIGQDPFSEFSTLSPIEMYRIVGPVLENLAHEAGWRKRKGLADG